MTVDELLAALAASYPRAPLEAWAGIYRAALWKLDGVRLREAFNLVMIDWRESYPPKPGHFVEAARASAPAPRSADGQAWEMPWEKADNKRAAMAKAINDRLWREYYRPWKEQAIREGWSHLLIIHIGVMSHDIAKAAQAHECSEDDALAHVNRLRYRSADAKFNQAEVPARQGWVDDYDIAGMRERGPQQVALMARAKPTEKFRRATDQAGMRQVELTDEQLDQIRREHRA